MMPLTITLNGRSQTFAELGSSATLAELVLALGLKADRIAIEKNGESAARPGWAAARVEAGDRIELVHFVGGGSR